MLHRPAMPRSRTSPLLAVALITAALSLAVLAARPVAAQIPDSFTNLQLLDKDIEQPKIVGIMRDWATGLGVRCNHCHVGPDNLEGMDFASDDKPTKRTARKMLEMSRTLNRELLADLPVVEEGERHQVVSCYTCHRGLPTPPRNLRVELGETFFKQGIEATLSHLGELKEKHEGLGRYDFSGQSLSMMGQQLLEMKRPDDAVAWFAGLVEMLPDDADIRAAQGLTLLQTGNKEAALTAFDKALALDPENRMARAGKARASG